MKDYHDTVNSFAACIRKGYLAYEPGINHRNGVIDQGTGYTVVVLQGTCVVHKLR